MALCGVRGLGALAAEEQFQGVDPKVPPARADEIEYQGKLETAAC